MKRGSRAKRRAVAAVLLSVLGAMPAFAGAGTWTRMGKTWKYITADGSIFHDTFTDTGYWVGTDGSLISSTVPFQKVKEKSAGGKRVIAISKAGHCLELWQDGVRVKRYPCSTGTVDGDKEREGDEKTPDGEFYICLMNNNSAYTKGIGLSYPMIEDAERGLSTGLISEAQYSSIVSAINRHGKPDWYTNLGGEIEIHGGSDTLGSNASRGCIVLTNADILDLFSRVSYGDTVLVYE